MKLIPGKIQPIEIQKKFIKEYSQLLKRAEKEEIHLFFFDPTHQIHNTINGKCWQIKGKKGTIKIKSNTGRKRITILGAVNVKTNIISSVITQNNCDSDMLKTTLYSIRNEYRNQKKIVMIVDNASYNKSTKLKI